MDQALRGGLVVVVVVDVSDGAGWGEVYICCSLGWWGGDDALVCVDAGRVLCCGGVGGP